MLKLIASAVVYLLLLALNYLALAFVAWDFNAAHWDGFVRFLMVLFGVAAFVLVVEAVNDADIDDDGEE